MNGKSGIMITQYHSKTSIIKMKHHSVVASRKLTRTRQIPTLTLTWSIIRTVPAYSNTTKKCAPFLHDKSEILL